MANSSSMLKFSTIATYQKPDGFKDRCLLTIVPIRKTHIVELYADVSSFNEFYTYKSTCYDVDIDLARDAWFNLRSIMVPSLNSDMSIKKFYNLSPKISAYLSCVFKRPIEVYSIANVDNIGDHIANNDINIKSYSSYGIADDLQISVSLANVNVRQDLKTFDEQLLNLLKEK